MPLKDNLPILFTVLMYFGSNIVAQFNGGVHDSIYAKGQLIDNESILGMPVGRTTSGGQYSAQIWLPQYRNGSM